MVVSALHVRAENRLIGARFSKIKAAAIILPPLLHKYKIITLFQKRLSGHCTPGKTSHRANP